MTTLRETMQDAFQEVCDQWSIYDEQTMGPIQMQVQVLTVIINTILQKADVERAVAAQILNKLDDRL